MAGQVEEVNAPLVTQYGRSPAPAVLDPGHDYRLLTLDGEIEQTLTFVKRFDPDHPEKFPGNTDAHPGTTLQSVLRSCLERLRYLQGQVPCDENTAMIDHLRSCLFLLEGRAARRHGLAFDKTMEECEREPMCPVCGHITCEHPEHVAQSVAAKLV
jgi:hypothetical protein